MISRGRRNGNGRQGFRLPGVLRFLLFAGVLAGIVLIVLLIVLDPLGNVPVVLGLLREVPRRRRILQLVQDGELTAGEIAVHDCPSLVERKRTFDAAYSVFGSCGESTIGKVAGAAPPAA